MCRARIRSKIEVQKIDEIKCDELRQIAYLYYIKEYSQLDIAFQMNLSEKTIYRRLKEIRTRYIA